MNYRFEKLEAERAAFFTMLAKVGRRMPAIESLWTKDGLDLEEAKKYMGVASSGETVMLKFMIGVWMGFNEFGFNLIDAVRILGEEDRAIIAEYCRNPIRP